MKVDKLMLKISDNQLKKLNLLVDYFKSDKAKVIRRGIYLISKLELDIKDFDDVGNKNNHFTLRLLEEELKCRVEKLYTSVNIVEKNTQTLRNVLNMKNRIFVIMAMQTRRKSLIHCDS